jgi:hypothetical protein
MAFSSKIFTAPKIGKGNISSPLSSGASKITKSTPKLRVNRINFGNRRIVRSPALESQSPVVNSSAIKSQSSIENTLSETNKILVDIQKQLALDFSTRIADEKEKNKTLKEQKSKRKFALKEGSLESVKKIGSIVKSGASAVLSPVESAFDKIIEFITLIGAGVAANTVFNWLSDEGNKKTLMGWFDWIKENWQWTAAAVGAIALLPLIATIGGILGPIGALFGLLASAVPLLLGLFMNPVFLGAIAAIGTGILIYKGAEAIRDSVTGGSEFSAAHDVLDQKLKEAGLDNDGKKREGGFLGMGRKEVEMTEDEKKLAADVLAKRKQLNSMRDDMEGELQKKNLEIDEQAGLTMSSSNSALEATQSTRDAAEKEIRAKYSERITQIVPLNIEARAKGGPVAPGTPYLVGEEGPELRVFEKGGSIISSPKTKNLLRNITPNKTKKTNIVTMDLPPQMLNSEKSPPARPAEPPIPKIPSTNVADMWRSKTPEMYGISV